MPGKYITVAGSWSIITNIIRTANPKDSIIVLILFEHFFTERKKRNLGQIVVLKKYSPFFLPQHPNCALSYVGINAAVFNSVIFNDLTIPGDRFLDLLSTFLGKGALLIISSLVSQNIKLSGLHLGNALYNFYRFIAFKYK